MCHSSELNSFCVLSTTSKPLEAHRSRARPTGPPYLSAYIYMYIVVIILECAQRAERKNCVNMMVVVLLRLRN